MLRGLGDRVPDLVVVLDRVLRLALGALGVPAARADLQQPRVEELLLGLGVHLEQDRQPLPDRGESGRVVGELVEQRERPPLLVVLGQDQLGDVHAGRYPSTAAAYTPGTGGDAPPRRLTPTSNDAA